MDAIEKSIQQCENRKILEQYLGHKVYSAYSSNPNLKVEYTNYTFYPSYRINVQLYLRVRKNPEIINLKLSAKKINMGALTELISFDWH